MLIVIQLISILILVTWIGFSTNESGVLYLAGSKIEPMLLSLLCILLGIFITLPLLIKSKKELQQIKQWKKAQKKAKKDTKTNTQQDKNALLLGQETLISIEKSASKPPPEAIVEKKHPKSE